MLFRPSFVTLAFALVAVGTPVKRDAKTVQSDIDTITAKSTTLDDAVSAFPNSGGTFSEALSIYNNSQDLASVIQDATDDVENSAPFTNDEAETILQSIQKLASIVQKGSNDLVAKQAAIAAAAGESLAEGAIDNIEENTNMFATKLIPKFPAGDQDAVQAVLNEIIAALSGAQQAYE